MKNWIDDARKQRELFGEKKYGHRIDPKNDPRCFRMEMLEELLDSLNYLEWSFLKGEISSYKRRAIEADLRRVVNSIAMPCMNRLRGGP